MTRQVRSHREQIRQQYDKTEREKVDVIQLIVSREKDCSIPADTMLLEVGEENENPVQLLFIQKCSASEVRLAAGRRHILFS